MLNRQYKFNLKYLLNLINVFFIQTNARMIGKTQINIQEMNSDKKKGNKSNQQNNQQNKKHKEFDKDGFEIVQNRRRK